MIIEVESETGALGDEIPRRFRLGERIILVVDMLDHWPGAEHGYYRVAGDDGARYILRHDLSDGHWELWMYDRPAPEEPSRHTGIDGPCRAS